MKRLLYGRAKQIAKNIDNSKTPKEGNVVKLSKGKIILDSLWPFKS